jgi:heptosyltransferase II
MEDAAMPGHPPSSILDARYSGQSIGPSRILVRGVNWLGDAVMTTPALHRLRERFPEARITLLTHEKLASLWFHHQSLDRVLTFDSGDGLWAIARRLRPENFDLALVLPNSPRSALEVWLARISQRVGYARSWRNWLLTHPIPARPGHVRMHKLSSREINDLIRLPAARKQNAARDTQHAHQIHEYLHLAAALGANPKPLAPQLVVTLVEAEAIVSKFELRALSNSSPILGLNPGAEYGPAKRWPAEQFIAAAGQIQQ